MDGHRNKPKETKKAKIGGVFELLDSVNDYARRKSSLMVPPI
jgi:hypothetical protein